MLSSTRSTALSILTFVASWTLHGRNIHDENVEAVKLTICRGFAIGWDYAISWLTVLPFELIAASLTIEYWRTDINVGVWITVFLVALVIVQVFGVRGYGEGMHAFSSGLGRSY